MAHSRSDQTSRGMIRGRANEEKAVLTEFLSLPPLVRKFPEKITVFHRNSNECWTFVLRVQLIGLPLS